MTDIQTKILIACFQQHYCSSNLKDEIYIFATQRTISTKKSKELSLSNS